MTVQPTRDQLRALADAATPGPWEDGVDDLTGDIHVHDELDVRVFVAWTGMEPAPCSREDAAFIVAARTALPQLLDQLDAMEALVDQMTGSQRFFSRLTEAEARIKAVEDVLDIEERSVANLDLGACGIGEGWSAAVSVADIRRALESVPPPRQ